MLNKVKAYIDRFQLFSHDKRYLVAVSGGADSVCLLLVMRALGYDIEAVHCNFHLRGEESNRDENFVVDLCKKLQVELHLIHFDTATYAQTHQISIEMAARELRYRYFEQLRQDIQADGICVAHHQDDSAETIILNLLRGTGIHGLTGIKPRNGYILRPLLCLSRKDIIEWLREQNQTFVTDSSNLETDAVRNKIRLNIMPQLKDISPNACQQILNTAQRLNEASKVYDETIQNTLSRLVKNESLEVDALLKEASPESILYEWLFPMGFDPKTIEQISQSLTIIQSGKEWKSATHQLTFNQGRLLAEPITPELPTLIIPETGTYIYQEEKKIRIEQISGRHIKKDAATASLDSSKVHFPLTLRPVQVGDRFMPYGMKGTKLVSDYLTDRHVNVFEKRRTLVLCDRQGEILWLINHRPDARFCINDLTQETLVFSFFNTKK